MTHLMEIPERKKKKYSNGYDIYGDVELLYVDDNCVMLS